MQTPRRHSRINLVELKVQIVKRLGPEGSKQYFYYLNKFLSSQVSKMEFSKVCLRILGRDNITIHNQLIRSILKNGFFAKAPSPSSTQKVEILSHGNGAIKRQLSGDAYKKRVSQNIVVTQEPASSGLSNGADILLPSPKARTGSRDWKNGDRRGTLRSNEKTSFVTEKSAAIQKSSFLDKTEDGEMEIPTSQAGEMPDVRSSDGSAPSCSKDESEFAVRDDPFRARSSSRCIGTLSDGILWDSRSLKERMEQIAVSHGVDGVSLDSANLLNHGLDCYITGLIKSCTQLMTARSGYETTRRGRILHHCFEMQQNSREIPMIRLRDLRLAMEVDPKKLGEDWPPLLEKICTQMLTSE